MKTVLKSEFAKMRGVTPGRVSQWLKKGVISAEPDGRIDPEKARAELDRNLDQGRRLDYEVTFQKGRSSGSDPGHDGPPPPFSGNFCRDSVIMGLTVFYPYFLNIMAPIFLKLLIDGCRVGKGTAQQMTILFGFETHEIIKEFLEKDVLDQWLRRNQDISLDQLQTILSRWPTRRTLPPKDLPTMDHPAFILELLKKGKKDGRKS